MNQLLANKRLLVLNYALNDENSIFGHQFEIVNRLSMVFKEILVITNEYNDHIIPKNVKVYKVDWKTGKSIRSTYNFYKVLIPITLTNKIDLAFSHMVDTQALLALPILKIRRIKHIFWYAHAKKSIRANIVSRFADMNISSTKGSYPLVGKNIVLLGQSINTVDFKFNKRDSFPMHKAIHIGRLDSSKKILEIIMTTIENRIHLHLWGRILDDEYGLKVKKLIDANNLTVRYHGVCKRDQIPLILRESDFFIHGFDGSLDKSILEATAVGCPVITLNQEYISEFGSWSGSLNTKDTQFLNHEIAAFKKLNPSPIIKELGRRRKIVDTKHTLGNWIHGFAELSTRLISKNHGKS